MISTRASPISWSVLPLKSQRILTTGDARNFVCKRAISLNQSVERALEAVVKATLSASQLTQKIDPN